MDIVIYSNGEIQCSYNVAGVFFFSASVLILKDFHKIVLSRKFSNISIIKVEAL